MDPRQEAQLRRYIAWVEDEGHVEGPTHLSTLMQPHQKQRLDWLKENVIGPSILECGCSWGYVLAYVNGQVGIDINPMNVTLAKVLSPDREFLTADIRDLPFPSRSFDTVMLPESIEHLGFTTKAPSEGLDMQSDVPKAIAEAKRVARQRILITCPDGRGENPDATNMKHPFLMDEEHLKRLLLYLWPFPSTVTFQAGFILVRCDIPQ